MLNPFKVGDQVILREDVLQRHARSIPAHLGYTTNQFNWRATLRRLAGQVGTVSYIFDNSKHTNVQFEGETIGIDFTELDEVVTEAETAVINVQIQQMLK